MPRPDDVFAIDIHSHFVPMAWLEEVARHPDAHGLEVRDEGSGYSLHRRDGQAPPSRLFAKLYDQPSRLAAMDGMGISQQLLAPPTPVLLYDLDHDPARAVARLYNETVSELCRASDGRFLPAATVPMGWPDVAAEELTYAVDQLGAKALYLSTSINGAALDEDRFDPVFRAAAEGGLPLLLHPTGATECRHLDDNYLHNVLGNPFETAVAAARMVNAGVLDRYPDLRVGLVHGGGVFPYLAGRMQHGHDNVPAARGSEQAPRTYLRRFYFDTVVHDPRALRFLAGTVGQDRLVIGTDYPYGMGDGDPLGTLEQGGISDWPAVAHGNAGVFLGM